MRLSATIKEVIDLANAIQTYWDSELPKHHPQYPIIHLDEDSGPPPPEEQELNDFLANLPDDVVYKLLLIMYLGRGDFGTDDLAGSYETLKRTFGNPDHAASQMMEKAPLAYYLSDGLAELNKNGINPDHLNFSSVSAGG